ncbi:MAG: hypothetical protein OEW80_13900 [Gemmatimonadota bacterium]|nr:hypothetical protein [Gemmatimonadota bacterium]
MKIGLGAAAVFAGGMIVVSIAGAARSAAATAMHNSLAGAGRMLASAAAKSDLPFLLDGARVGTIRNVDVRRTARGALPEVQLTVDLSPSQGAARLAGCDLVPVQDGDLDPDRGFRCAGGSTRGHTTIGFARFEPGALQRPIRVSRSMESELRQGDPFEARADLGGTVKISARGDSGELVNVLADSSGVSVRVQDGMQRAVLRLLADSTGASLRVRGDDGKVVRLEANQSGLVIRVDSATAP